MSRPPTLAAPEPGEGGRAMERTDMATPEKINNRRQTPNDQFSIPSKNQARPMLPACDALALTLVFPFLTDGQDRIMHGHVPGYARSMRTKARQCAPMRANARFELLRGFPCGTARFALLAPIAQAGPLCSLPLL